MSLDDDQPTETPVPTGVPGVPPLELGEAGDPWTAADIATLKALRSCGVSFRKIAERLGRTRNAIIGKANRLKLPQLRAVPPRPTAVHPQSISAARARSTARSAGKVWPEPEPSPEPLRDLNAGTIARVSFDDLECHHCRWPVDTTQGVGYCGLDAVPGMSWCDEHRKRVFSAVELRPLTEPKARPAYTKTAIGPNALVKLGVLTLYK